MRTDNSCYLIVTLNSKIICFKREMIDMAKKNCLDCVAYCNMLPDGKCGLGFDIEEVMETSEGFSIAVHPVGECTVAMPRTRKDFVKKAAERGIEWDLGDVVTKSMIM